MPPKVFPVVMGTILGVMVMILTATLLLFYRKRKESIELRSPLERMTRGLSKRMTKKKNDKEKEKERLSGSSNNSFTTSNNSLEPKPANKPILQNTQFWVPEVYQAIVQPSPSPSSPRKVSRLQSTLDREIYSRTHDTSYLEVSDPDVFNETHSLMAPGTPGASPLSRRGTGTRSSRRMVDNKRLASGDENRGMLNFSVQYIQDKALLMVTVIKAEALPCRKDNNLCDPFVDLQVRPYYQRRMHSEIHQKTVNPTFNQLFEFEVPPYEIKQQVVEFTVLDFSQQLTHETIGQVLFPCSSVDYDAFIAGKEFALWKKIDRNSGNQTGNNSPIIEGRMKEYGVEMEMDKCDMLLLLSISYHKVAERLTVVVDKARNLLPADKKGKLDHPYVTVTLTHVDKMVKKLRTAVQKHECNPAFNKTLLFELPLAQIGEMSLTVKMKHHNELGRDRTFAVLNLGGGAGAGTGHEQWNDMLNNTSSETIQRWHRLIPIETDDS